MRRVLALIVAVPMLAYAFPATAKTSIVVQNDPGPGGFTSPNVDYVGTIPIDSPGVGGKVVQVGNQTRFYVTGLKGITIYDVTDPALPVPLGAYPFPHAQNEDVEVSEDGSRLVIAADGSLLVPVAPTSIGVHVFDVSDPADIELLGSYVKSEHTATCADTKCEWIYGRTGTIYDARDPANIKIAGDWRHREVTGVNSSHALIRDESGLIISDSNPRLVLDPNWNAEDPAAGFAAPKLLAFGGRNNEIDDSLQHNSVRLDGAEWQTREPLAEDATPEEIAEYEKLRPGELLVGNSESNVNPQCSTPGGLSTWSMKDFDKGATLTQIESFRPFNGTWADGNPAINGLGCSGHWFTVTDDYYVAAAWYEHGIHFFKVDPTNGNLTEVGFFQPVATEAGAAHWVGDNYVYTVDYARGIDILRFDRGAPEPTKAERDAAWLSNLDLTGAFAERERYSCSLAIRG
jgi:hypothetical protein